MLYDSVVHPAIADKTGTLTNSQATIEFYMRIAEAKASANVLATRVERPSATYVSASRDYLAADDVAAIADSLITALQIAKPIISAMEEPSQRSKLDLHVQRITLDIIDEALKSAQKTFPNAESFKMPQQ